MAERQKSYQTWAAGHPGVVSAAMVLSGRDGLFADFWVKDFDWNRPRLTPLPNDVGTDGALNLRTLAMSERERAERAQSNRRDDAEFMRRVDEAEAVRRAAYRFIKTAAGLACSDPEAFDSQSQDGQIVGAGIDEPYLSSYLMQDENEVGWKSLGVKPNGCQKDVIEKLINSSGPVAPGVIAGWARAYRDAHPSLLRRFATSLNELFESKGDYQSYQSETVRYNGKPSERTESLPSHDISLKGSGISALRGIAGSGW